MSIFDYSDYKKFVNEWIDLQPRNGHGQLRKIADHLKINSVIMSQVFRGDRDLSLEQTLGVANFMGLSDLERDFFLLLVQKERAGTHQLKTVLEGQIQAQRAASQALKNRIKHHKYSEEDRAHFYSHWYYSAIRLGLSIPELSSISSIADYLDLERSLVSKVVEFLLKNKLIVESKTGFDMGPQVTHIGHDSPFVNRHHNNWRLKSLQAMDKTHQENLFYTGPMALSEKASDEIRKLLIELIEKSTKAAAKSDSEVLRCLNIDWFKV